jgi:hypothetical protein
LPHDFFTRFPWHHPAAKATRRLGFAAGMLAIGRTFITLIALLRRKPPVVFPSNRRNVRGEKVARHRAKRVRTRRGGLSTAGTFSPTGPNGVSRM